MVRASDVECALVALGFGLIVGLDGSPLWCVVRVMVVALVCVGVAVIVRTQSQRVGAAALVVLGTIATPVGATIAYSYLTTTGISAKAVGGLVAAAGGTRCARRRHHGVGARGARLASALRHPDQPRCRLRHRRAADDRRLCDERAAAEPRRRDAG